MRVYPGIVSEDGGVRKPSVVHFETLQPLENAGCSANLIVGVRAGGCAQHSELLDPRSVGTRALGPFGPCIVQRVYVGRRRILSLLCVEIERPQSRFETEILVEPCGQYHTDTPREC